MKLYRVTLRGMTSTLMGTQTAYGAPFVVADSLDGAYQVVRGYLDRKDLGFTRDREVDRVELLAEEGDYPSCLVQLHIERPTDVAALLAADNEGGE